MQRKPLVRLIAGAAAGLALAVAAPLAASAHVTIDPDQATAGGWVYVTFRAPNESSTATTTKIDVHLPTSQPITTVSYQPTPGWTASITTEDLAKPVKVEDNTITKAPTSITFEAAPGAGTAPGQFQMFTVALGPIPDTGHIVLPVTQTYSDGTVVEWKATPEDVAKDATLEPAPVIYVNDAPPSSDHHGSAATPAPQAAVQAGSQTESVALGISIAALVLAVGGVLFTAVALRRRRKEDA
jgi:uncharacterized protein YcnI